MTRWMKVDRAREYAGGVSRKVLYSSVASSRLKAARVGAGRNLLFCEQWLDDWLRQSAEQRRPVSEGASGPGPLGVESFSE